VWDAAFETLASLGPPADKEHAIDSTIVRAHQHASCHRLRLGGGAGRGARDCGDRPQVSALIAEHGVDAIVHFAASIVVPDSVRLSAWRSAFLDARARPGAVCGPVLARVKS
jgi:hypothetical protein